jgi:phosphoribosyl 1,2-cyclic phosphodiesterase
MKFASLGSGSEGNALLVSSGQTHVLLDCGFSLKETVARLARLDVTPFQLNGIVVTHEHGDHIGGVARLARQYRIPVWLTRGTHRAQPKAFEKVEELHEIDVHQCFNIGDLAIQPYPVPHDAAEPVQYLLSGGAKRLGVLTDAGCSTPYIEQMLSGCDALVLECNHDSDMLMNGSYPYSLKQRVAGRFGHLSNAEAAALLARLDTTRLQHLIAAHLSAHNNTQALAVSALCGVLNCEPEWIGVATQHEGFGWREII